MNNPNTPQLTPHALAGLETYQEVLNKLMSDMVAWADQNKPALEPKHAELLSYRMKFAFSYYEQQLKNVYSWLYTSREDQNFTYDLTEMNKNYMASYLSVVSGAPVDKLRGYIDELNNDEALRTHIRQAIVRANNHDSDPDARYGRRLGWYALVRAMKPKVVIETGVDKGMGSCVLASAIMRNNTEGFPGYYFGTDISPHAGYLFTGIYQNYGRILYGDSIESLQKFDQNVDVFINDSDHSADYEYREYQTIINKMSPNGVILGDNSHVTDRLHKFSVETNRKFIFVPEKPDNHWYPGAGIGISFK